MRKELIIILSIFTVAISFVFDKKIIQGVSLFRNNILNEFFLGITFVSSEVIIFFFLTSLFLWKKYKRRWILPLWLTLFFSVVVSFVLKYSIHRARPFQQGLVSVLPLLEKSSHLTWNFSFPSFQAMLVFCAIPILAKEFPKFKYVWIIFAGLVAFSRVYFGLHFLSDVIVGGLLGLILGWGMIKFEEKYGMGKKVYEKVLRRY
ncbi:MAG: phosphatase PAP2 family protein [Nanoarchaeota archaeon]